MVDLVGRRADLGQPRLLPQRRAQLALQVPLVSYYFLIHAKIDDAFFIPIYVLLTISISFSLAFVSWHAIEKPFLALKGRFESKKHPTDLHETPVRALSE